MVCVPGADLPGLGAWCLVLTAPSRCLLLAGRCWAGQPKPLALPVTPGAGVSPPAGKLRIRVTGAALVTVEVMPRRGPVGGGVRARIALGERGEALCVMQDSCMDNCPFESLLSITYIAT